MHPLPEAPGKTPTEGFWIRFRLAEATILSREACFLNKEVAGQLSLKNIIPAVFHAVTGCQEETSGKN
jgi:hypothetical protein